MSFVGEPEAIRARLSESRAFYPQPWSPDLTCRLVL